MILTCFHQELSEELGELEASSDEEAMVTTRVVRRRVIIQVPAHCTLAQLCPSLRKTRNDRGCACSVGSACLESSSCFLLSGRGGWQPSSVCQLAEERSGFLGSTCLSSCLFIFVVWLSFT